MEETRVNDVKRSWCPSRKMPSTNSPTLHNGVFLFDIKCVTQAPILVIKKAPNITSNVLPKHPFQL